LILAGDGRRSGEIVLQDLVRSRPVRTRLMVLAGCGTAAGAPARGEGAISLAHAMLASGVPSVVGGLWDVDDRASRIFFVTFHRHVAAGMEPARALRATQLELWRSEDPALRSPATWAAFITYGGMRNAIKYAGGTSGHTSAGVTRLVHLRQMVEQGRKGRTVLGRVGVSGRHRNYA
jgi:CHAT domain-containing protein